MLGALCAFLCCACYHDYRYRKIPNLLVVIILIGGFGVKLYHRDFRGLGAVACVVAVTILLLYPFFRWGALGAGDVKLLGVCAGYLSCDKVLYFIFFSLLIAAVISIVYLMIKRDVKEYRKTRMPLAGPVLGSILLCMGGVY